MKRKILLQNFSILIAISLFILAGCSSYENVVSQKKEVAEVEDIKVYGINESFVFEDWEYTVLGFEESNEYNGYETDNKFIIVTIKVKNNGKKPATISNDYFILIDEDDRIYESDSTRDISLQDDMYFSIVDKINPGLKKEGRISFETPQDVNKFMLAIRNNMFDFGGAEYRYVILKSEILNNE